MSYDQMTQTLISRLPKHLEADKMRLVITESLAAAEHFEAKRRELERSGHLTPHGRREALKEALVKRFARDLRDAQKPIGEARERLRTMREAVKVRPSADPNNVVAAMERQEMRATIAEMPEAERMAFVLKTTDPRIIEAVLGQPAVVSGLADDVFAKVETAYQARVFAKEMLEIRALEAVISEAQAAAAVARDEMRRTSGLDRNAFDKIVVPIEQKRAAPWLLEDKASGHVLVVEPGQSTYKPATEDQLRDGVFYKNFEDYQAATKGASQAAA